MIKQIPNMNRKWLTLAVTLCGLAFIYSLVIPNDAQAIEPVFQSRGVAIRGYDAVAYFTDKRAVKGKKAFQAKWNGATWNFYSAENRDKFLKKPQQYAPQYGGYCAFAVAQNQVAPINPRAWTVHKNKLYLNYSIGVKNAWLSERDDNIRKGDKNWPGLINQ